MFQILDFLSCYMASNRLVGRAEGDIKVICVKFTDSCKG